MEEINIKSSERPSMDEMLNAGVQFGHRKSKFNSKMTPYILTTRNDVHIFDLEKTQKKLQEALNVIADIASKGGIILFIGTKTGRQKIAREAAQSCGMPFVDKRWLGGTLTNFKTMLKRLEKLADLEKKMQEGGFSHYTKREQSKLKEELRKLEEKFGGFKHIRKIPQALVILSLKEDIIAAREAKQSGVKCIAISDSNADPDFADCVIPANDDALSSLRLISQLIAETINNAKKLQGQEIKSEK